MAAQWLDDPLLEVDLFKQHIQLLNTYSKVAVCINAVLKKWIWIHLTRSCTSATMHNPKKKKIGIYFSCCQTTLSKMMSLIEIVLKYCILDKFGRRLLQMTKYETTKYSLCWNEMKTVIHVPWEAGQLNFLSILISFGQFQGSFRQFLEEDKLRSISEPGLRVWTKGNTLAFYDSPFPLSILLDMGRKRKSPLNRGVKTCKNRASGLFAGPKFI